MSRLSKSTRRRFAAAAVTVVAAIGGGLVVNTTASAVLPDTGIDASGYSYARDVGGANDIPGQKDLNLHGVKYGDAAAYLVYWQWDDTRVSGGNTLDGCSLVDIDGNLDKKPNLAICATLSRTALTNSSPILWTLYSCGNQQNNRCDGAVARLSNTLTGYSDTTTGCSPIDTSVQNPFTDVTDLDTRIYCRIKMSTIQTLTGSSSPNLSNTCSYPSSSPTSAPSDCVLPDLQPATTTISGSSTLVPNTSITINGYVPGGTTDSVTFTLHTDSGCTSSPALLTISGATINASGVATTSNTTSIANATGQVLYWKAVYTGNNLNLTSNLCYP